MVMARGLFLLVALGAALAFVSVGVESRSSPMDKASQEDRVKPDCVPAFDPRSFPGHGGTTTPLPSHGGSGTTPSHGSGGYGATPTAPSHGGSGSGTLPVPSHGGGYGTTPAAPSHGGYGSSPAAPSHGGYGSSPAAPSTGGGYGGSPTAPSHGGGYGSSPSTPSHGGYGSSPTPSHGGAYGGGGSTPTPTPYTGGHGLIPVDPTSPGTCDYWRSHPMEIWSALGRWPGSVGHFFGSAGGAAAGGTGVSIQDALSNTRADSAGALLREGAAALLNSMTRAGFPYTTEQVRTAFALAAAGGSDHAAAAQAAAFKKANEGRA
ncbi:hypothetical protein GUJ93_ZPchr0001g30413 [Zizania palustris]|uniref:Meiosis 5 n=1 Tax=Zizania palustris TaxID=103762 RepID=A0A8J5R767_ZIZPA|nr:hypothetical protein GUJ93_ZPchr0001g30413 [Zizania palustris]